MTGQPRASAPPRSTLRRLAEVRSEPDGVLSVYMDLDPSVFPTPGDRQTQIDVLVSDAEESFAGGDVAHEKVEQRKQAVGRLRDVLNDDDIVKDGTRSVAVFVAPESDTFEVLRLGEPVAPTVVVGDSPYIRPLADQGAPRTWAVLLCDRRRARIFYGGPHRLFELASFEDPSESQTSVGGWSQARYERHSDELAHDHVTHTLNELFELYQRVRFDALAVAAPDPLWNEVVDALHNELKDRVRGRVKIEIEHPTPDQVLEQAREVFEEAHEQAVNDVLASLEERARELVAVGPKATLQALSEQRVETLVLAERFESQGVRCPDCGWLGVDESKCGFDQKATEKRDDIVDDAIDSALTQSARVVTVSVESERQPPEPIAALLRY